MATSVPLFNALASAKFTHKYEVVWAELPSAEFNARTKAWLKLLGKVIGGPSSKERKALAQEFLQFLYVYKQMLEKLTHGTRSPEPGIEADVTLGVGAGGGGEFTVYQDNIGRAFNSLFYSAYLTLLGQSKERDAWRTYFRDLEDNQILFERADKIIDEALTGCYIEYQTNFTQLQAWKQMEALSCFKANKPIADVIAL